jgi:signal transduction histidine kinase
MSVDEDTFFSRLVSLACHDLRTPLATVLGFSRTLTRAADLEPPADRYVEMIDVAAGQMADLLDDLALVARIESGRWEPVTESVSVDELVREAAARGRDEAVAGAGGTAHVERAVAVRMLAGFAHAARRHGGLERVQLRAEGADVHVGPVAADVAPVVLGQDLRDLGAAVGIRVLHGLGGEAQVTGEALVVRLPPDRA